MGDDTVPMAVEGPRTVLGEPRAPLRVEERIVGPGDPPQIGLLGGCADMLRRAEHAEGEALEARAGPIYARDGGGSARSVRS